MLTLKQFRSEAVAASNLSEVSADHASRCGWLLPGKLFIVYGGPFALGQRIQHSAPQVDKTGELDDLFAALYETFCLNELTDTGARLSTEEDQHGETRTGWWLDTVYCGDNVLDALAAING